MIAYSATILKSIKTLSSIKNLKYYIYIYNTEIYLLIQFL